MKQGILMIEQKKNLPAVPKGEQHAFWRLLFGFEIDR